jgi:uncharacterized protein YidB (DUF937 family)
MALLDEIITQVTQNSNLSQPLQAVVKDLLQCEQGTSGTASSPQCSQAANGVGNLVSQLEAAGLSAAVNSWVGAGKNIPLQPAHLGTALGEPAVTQMAQKAGVSKDDLLTELAQALPVIIAKLSAPPAPDRH